MLRRLAAASATRLISLALRLLRWLKQRQP
jgi:hypothetical protein